MLDLIDGDIAGNPISGQCWVCRSLMQLQTALAKQEHSTSCGTIRRLLLKHDISPKSNVKRLVPDENPDRDTQFNYIQAQRKRFQAAGWPIISVDTKKKELIGPFKNSGQVWCREATSVYMHDFPSDAIGKAVPYGIYWTLDNRPAPARNSVGGPGRF